MAGKLRDQQGSGTMLLCCVLAILLLVTWVGAIGGSYAVAMHRTRGLADRAALAGALAYAQGREPCAAAGEQMAVEAHDALLAGCRLTGDPYRYVVSVTVEYGTDLAVPALPPAVRATAHAGPVEAGPGPFPAPGG